METLSPGPNPRIGEPCAVAVFTGDPARGEHRGRSPARPGLARSRGWESSGCERRRNTTEAQEVENLTQDPGTVMNGSSAVTNLVSRAGVFLGKQERLRRAHPDERSRNIIDKKGRPDLCGNWPAEGGRIEIRSPQSVQVTVTPGRVPVTLVGGGKIMWQAGMSKRMSRVRDYVRLHVTESPEYRRFSNEEPENSGKHPRYPGMYKVMSSLAGYVACRDRDSWDF